MTIAVDFDGTIVKHKYPKIGEDIGAIPVLKRLVENGHKLILNTMRSHKLSNGVDTLQDAVNWLKEKGIDLYGINENPTQKSWTDSPKVYANMYIDDSSLGIPLLKDEEGNTFVNWDALKLFFEKIGLI